MVNPSGGNRVWKSESTSEFQSGIASCNAREIWPSVWFWPKVTAAITAKHPWLVIACDSCGTVVDLDLRVKPRDPEASVPVALRDVRCPRCNGHGRPRIMALSQHPLL